MQKGGYTMPILPDLVRGDNGKVGDFFVDVFRVNDNALGQYHGHTRIHWRGSGMPLEPSSC